MSILASFSETAQENKSLNIPISTNLNEQSDKQTLKSKKRVFEVFHKKEIIYINQDSVSNNEESKSSSIQYKCIYCGNSYNSINRFETHMKIHVSLYCLIIYLNIDRRKAI